MNGETMPPAPMGHITMAASMHNLYTTVDLFEARYRVQCPCSASDVSGGW